MRNIIALCPVEVIFRIIKAFYIMLNLISISYLLSLFILAVIMGAYLSWAYLACMLFNDASTCKYMFKNVYIYLFLLYFISKKHMFIYFKHNRILWSNFWHEINAKCIGYPDSLIEIVLVFSKLSKCSQSYIDYAG